MRIKSIEIINVKGIEKAKFELNLKPNKPNILVAPNGFGKTSFGIAFNSLNRDKIVLNDKNLHNNKKTNLPEINIEIVRGTSIETLKATSTSNTILNVFDIVVINSQLKAKASILNIKGKKFPKSSMEIEPVTLIQTVPEKIEFKYKAVDIRREFGENGKVLPDISELLKCNACLEQLHSEITWTKFNGKKVTDAIAKAKELINTYKGTSETIKQKFENEALASLKLFEELNKLSELLSNFDSKTLISDFDRYFGAIQIIDLNKKLGANFKKAIKYSTYLNQKEEFIQIINSVNSTRIKVKPKEDKNKGLFIEWPKAHQVSNGERDVLSLITLLLKARRSLKKQNGILIIDEIFDYLDDANLIAFQYFISDFIEKMGRSGKNIFPILMTHLDPLVFEQFVFQKHKMRVQYLKDVAHKASPELLKIIYNREDGAISENLSKYFFHYYPSSITLDTDFNRLGLNMDWSSSDKFHKRNERELRKYLLEDKKYDPIAVCIALRRRIEKLMYDRIRDTSIKSELVNVVRKTKNKLEFCANKGINVPELFFLLGIIHNSSLHLQNGQDISQPLALKLENITIKKMIYDVFQD